MDGITIRRKMFMKKQLSIVLMASQRTGWGQYLTEGTAWVSCEIPAGDNSYYGWLFPVEDISFDPRLKLPAMWTEG